MILTPVSTDNSIDPTTKLDLVNLYYNIPPGDNWQTDLNDTVASLQKYLTDSNYSLTDSGQTTDGGVYITYLKGTIPPALVSSSYASTVGAPSVISNFVDNINSQIIALGKNINGGTLTGTGGITLTTEIILAVIFLFILFMVVKK